LPIFLFTQHHWRRLGRLTGYIHRDAEQMLAKIPGRALLFYESDCSETLTVGWIHSPFPKRYRDDRDRVVTYPRPPLSQLRAYLERYRDRDCWYLRRAQEEGGRYQLWPCSHAARFFNRAVFFQEANCLGIRSTAERMGMYKPVEANKLRREKWRSETKGTKHYRDFRRKYQQMEKRTPGLFLPPPQPRSRSSLSKEQ
ncbi:MAG: hypothetical protein RBU30_08865, partial [Polyangia bacterium]|nr:hypothetical protein [Polyangia bacterium]